MSNGHAKFSPSNSKRWLNCTMSMLLKSDRPQESSEHANRGTAIHAAAEDVLTEGKMNEARTYEGYTLTDDDVALTMQPYVDFVLAIDADIILIEAKVKVTNDCYGTADYVSFNTKTGVLDVCDLKAGQGVFVYAKNNTQLRIYALGAIKLLEEKGYTVQKVRTHIIQPGIDNFGFEEVSLEELMSLESQIVETIAQVKQGFGVYSPGEEECRWCDHKINCPKLIEMAQASALDDFSEEVSLSDKLKMVAPLKQFIKAIEAESLEVLQHGKALPGFKLVNSRGTRKIKDEKDLLSKLMDAGIDTKIAYGPKKFLTAPQLEKVIKKGKFAFDLDSHIFKTEGSEKVVPNDDEKDAVDKTASAINDFK